MKPQHITNKQTAAQAIVNCMKIEKVRHVFCVPGESYLPILDALYDSPTIDVISARHEGGAAFMAEGYAKSNLKPGIVRSEEHTSELQSRGHLVCRLLL